jgi:hypothetical protein
MRKREKALREYLYTTPLMLQYPGALSGALMYFTRPPSDENHV